MAATGNVPLEQEIGDRNECPVAASQHLYRGSMAFANAAGRATTVLGAKFLGHVVAEADNSAGGEGAINAVLMAGRYRLQVTLAGVALTDVGKQVFASDDNTLTLVAAAHTLVGQVVRYVAANTAIVEFCAVTDDTNLVVPQAHIAAVKADYAAGDVGDAAAIAAAIDAVATAFNTLLTQLEGAGINASS